ncbi:MAG: hypothetical protein ACRDLB_16205 [Actinomycetota bacterium]
MPVIENRRLIEVRHILWTCQVTHPITPTKMTTPVMKTGSTSFKRPRITDTAATFSNPNCVTVVLRAGPRVRPRVAENIS